ncbi:MAG TPA: SsrA-binding protein SmpB, partial [Lacipirellulaceae bacterium]
EDRPPSWRISPCWGRCPAYFHSLRRGMLASMAKQDKKSKKAAAAADKNERVIADNRKARHNYHVLDTLECGIVLAGSEVKSLRAGGLSLDEAYGRVEGEEVWLVGANIAEYSYSHDLNHVPKRRRKLLMHRREIRKFAGQAFEKGLTLVPLKMYFKQGRAKVLMGICRGKQKHDKRTSIKERESKRDIDRAMRRK